MAAPLPSTPRKTNPQAPMNNVTDNREAIANANMRTFHTCPMKDFMDRYRPFKPTRTNLNTFKTALSARGLLKSDENAWTAEKFLEGVKKENQIHAKLQPIFDAIAACKAGRREATCFLVNSSTYSLDADRPGGSHMPDAYFGLTEAAAGRVVGRNISDCAVITEFKVSASKRYDNNKKALSAAHFAIDDDPSRLWIYAFTIEGDQCSLWYFSRSQCIKSEPFNYVQDPAKFIEVYASFIFATPEELGFDPLVTLKLETVAPGTETTRYIFRVGELCFKTIGAIDSIPGLCIIGRGRRIWKVVRVSHPDDLRPLDETVYVLKEVWLDRSALSEAEIQEKIFLSLNQLKQAIDNSNPPLPDDFVKTENAAFLAELKAALGDYESRFLTRVANYKSMPSHALAANAVLDPSIFPKPLASLKPAGPRAHHNRVSGTNHAGTYSGVLEMPSVVRKFGEKRLHRMVSKELCETLYDVETPDTAVHVVQETLKTLCLLFLAGWVHRDISPGNILHYNGRVILADLEYAQELDQQGRSKTDAKTGTPFFTAVEIRNRALIWKILQSARVDDHAMPSDDPRAYVPRRGSPPIRHNYVHDIESLFWIVLWLMAMRMKSISAQYPTEEVKLLFQDRDPQPPERTRAIMEDSYLYEILEQRKGLPAQLRNLAQPMDFCRNSLNKAYQFIDPWTSLTNRDAIVAAMHIRARNWISLVRTRLGEAVETGGPLLLIRDSLDSSDSSELPASPPPAHAGERRQAEDETDTASGATNAMAPPSTRATKRRRPASGNEETTPPPPKRQRHALNTNAVASSSRGGASGSGAGPSGARSVASTRRSARSATSGGGAGPSGTRAGSSAQPKKRGKGKR